MNQKHTEEKVGNNNKWKQDHNSENAYEAFNYK